MFVDASAVVAILGEEEDGPALLERLGSAGRGYTSPIAACEAVLALARVSRAALADVALLVDDFIKRLEIETIPITAEIGGLAVEAFARFGRGRHAARLNMGDCFAYACAKSLGVPLLFKGDDFSQTDIATA
jgi:ribonuclease VapC